MNDNTPDTPNESSDEIPNIIDLREFNNKMNPDQMKLFMKQLELMSRASGRTRKASKKPIASPAKRKAKRSAAKASRRRNRKK